MVVAVAAAEADQGRDSQRADKTHVAEEGRQIEHEVVEMRAVLGVAENCHRSGHSHLDRLGPLIGFQQGGRWGYRIDSQGQVGVQAQGEGEQEYRRLDNTPQGAGGMELAGEAQDKEPHLVRWESIRR